jgi:hypothetical protein
MAGLLETHGFLEGMLYAATQQNVCGTRVTSVALSANDLSNFYSIRLLGLATPGKHSDGGESKAYGTRPKHGLSRARRWRVAWR